MIIYFTGTGNSKFVADVLAEELGDETVSLNNILKNGLPKRFSSEKPYVVVSPIYAWRLPSFVSDFISDAVFEGDRRMYVVATMGQNTGKADEHVSRLVSGKGMEFMGFTGIVMTDNYIVWSGMPGKEVYMETVKKAEDTARSVAMSIREGKHITKIDKTGMAGLKSGFINRMFSKHMNDPGFSFTDRCTSCGVCESFCPANNISMKDGKPVFLMKCFSCFGCIHRCPANAIVIKGKTESRGQYVCPEYGRKE